MLEYPYQFALLLGRENGSTLGLVPVEPDWGPALECTRLYFARRGELAVVGGGEGASIRPLWDSSKGAPNCRGFRVVISRNGARPVSSDYTTGHFRALARQASAQLVEEGKLAAGDHFQYRVVAYERDKKDEQEEAGRLNAEERTPAVALLDSTLADWRRRSAPSGVVDDDDMPVFIPRHVLDEAAALTAAERGRETGGVLIGNLRRDPDLPEIFAEVTAQISAEHTRGDAVKLTFTSDTWAAADAAIKLRRRSEVYLGYWHSHPVREWCKSRQCTPEKQQSCSLARDFFSADDQALLRAVFPRAYSLGLVVNDTSFEDLTFSLFGWREGSIGPRGFYILEEIEKNNVAITTR